MKRFINKFFYVCLVCGLLSGATSCSDDDDPVTPDDNGGQVDPDDNDTDGDGDDNGTTGKRTYFNLVVGIDVEGSGATYAAAYEDLSQTDLTISFEGFGYEVPSVRTARVYGSEDGKFIYNLSYGGGTISKYTVNGGQDYSEVKMLDISLAMGTNNPRWTKVNENYALMHNVTTSNVYHDEAGTSYSYTNTEAVLTAIDLDAFSILNSGGVVFDFPRSEEDNELNLHVWRIDAPAVHNGKAYYGLNKRSYDPSTATNISTSDYSASSLVVDFPALTNPKIITSGVGKGSTQGYRTPVAHVDEKGDIYQITGAPSYLLKISDGDYDDSFVFSLSEAIGYEVGSNGWFYVGDGIGYVPFYNVAKGSGSDVAAWGVARVDIYNKTAVVLNLPSNLWLYQYQYGVTGNDGKFYMAITPLGGEGNIYIFDPASTSADGFTKGASIKTIDSTSAYLGVF